MALKTKSIRGTRDIVPGESYKWQHVESMAFEVASRFGMSEIRVPTIEKTELFIKSVGETTDVVQKEMYSFEKGRENITLRPEGTAGVVRAVMENGLLGEALPVKVSYILSCFRHENPQAGRLREFHQFGVECFGCPSPSADAEVIAVAAELFDMLGLGNVRLEINSIGCPSCRPAYNQMLVDYFKAYEGALCNDCKERLGKNPLRLLDCKEGACKKIAENAPLIVDHLCGECAEHFSGLKRRLDAIKIEYEVNPKIVRGLDYYTKTVFEFISDSAGAQGTVCGGGRYDGLVESMGGARTPALGFAMGLERLLMVMEAEECEFPDNHRCDIYVGSIGEEENIQALSLCSYLRHEGCFALCDTVGRSVKAQMKYADKIGAAYSCIIGAEELAKGEVTIRHMESGETAAVPLDDEEVANYLVRGLTELRFGKNSDEVLDAFKALMGGMGMLPDDDEEEQL